MENKPIDSPFADMVRDALPYTAEKYGFDKVSLFVELCFRAKVSPIDSFDLIERFFPLTPEEQEIEERRILMNREAFFLLYPEERAKYEVIGKIIKAIYDVGDNDDI
jgi:hypothetical protein